MYTIKPIPNLDYLRLKLTSDSLKNELNVILHFATDICEIENAFISLIIEQKEIIISKIGLSNLNTTADFNKNVIGLEEGKKNDFITNFPIKTSNPSISAKLCIFNKKNEKQSDKELKIINHCVSQIKSLLNLNLKNSNLEFQYKEQRNKFESLIENSNEIVYEIDLEGNINYVSKNWTKLVGHQLNEVIGKNNIDFIHPDDVSKCFDFLSSIQLNKKNDKEITYRVLHKKGHYVWHTTKVNLIERNGEQLYIGNCSDVTKHIETEKNLKDQKDFYEKILDRLPTDVAVFSPEHKYLYVNPVAIKDDKLRKFIIGKDDIQYANYTNRNLDKAIARQKKFKEAIEKRTTIEWIEKLYDKNGNTSYHHRKFTPVFDNEDKLEMAIGFSVDITESRKIQNEILKSRQLTKSIIENVAVGILVQGSQSEIIENNIAALEMLGLSQDQLLGKTSFDNYWQVIHEDGSTFKPENHPVPQAIKNLKPINNVVMGVHRPTKKDLVWLLVDAIPVFNEQEQLLYVICSFNNITHQKKTEEALTISNERFEYVTKATSDVIWDWDLATDEILLGDNFTEHFGHQFKNNNNIISATECEMYVHPDDNEKINNRLNQILNNTKINRWNDEYRYLKSDGTYAFVKEKAIIIRNKAGIATRLIGALTDITNEKKLQDKLMNSEKKFKDTFEYSPIGITIADYDGYIIDANEQICKTFGYSKEELKTLTFSDFTHPDDIEIGLKLTQELKANIISFFQLEKRYIHKSGRIVWGNLSASIVRDSNGDFIQFIGQVTDITERKKVEEENRILIEENNRNRNIQLNEAKNLYRLLADNTIDLVCLHDLDMIFQYVSPSIKILLGYTPEDLIGKTPMDFAHPEDITGMTNDLYKFISGNLTTPIQYRYFNIKGEYIWLETIAKIVFENEIPVKIQTSTRDITKRKEAEIAIEKTLKRERELNELRTNLVSTISHEFRTPMTTIRTSAELIEMYIEGQNCDDSNQLKRQINRITDEIDRIVELMNAVLTISKDDSGKTNFDPIKFDLKDLCVNVIETSFSNLPKNRKVDTRFEGENFIILADKNLIQYSLFNLLNNAFKYSEDSGNVFLKLKEYKSKIQIEITDFGIGIPEEDQPKLFNTFFRASNTNGIQGTGLGLYIVKTFIEKNSGTIKLESQLGKGTTVILELPKP